MKKVTYDRPVEATLIVRTAGGEEWEATDEDLKMFGLDIIQRGYYDFADAVHQILEDNGLDLGHKGENFMLDSIVQLASTIIYHGLDWRSHLDTRDKRVIAALEHILRATLAMADKGGALIYDNLGDFEHVPIAPMMSHLQRAQAFLDTPRIEE